MRILVADDHPLFRDGISSLLEAAGYEVVSQVEDGEAAVTDCLRFEPDVVLMDIRMPGMDGIEALRQIKAKLPHIRVVMLTASESESGLLESIKIGASGYLLKGLNADGLLASLRGLERGEMAMSRQTVMHVIEGFVSHVEDPGDPIKTLTTREVELLSLVVEGLSNRGIAYNLSVSENTVKYHLKKILRKLKVQNRTEAVALAIRAGLFEPKHPG